MMKRAVAVSADGHGAVGLYIGDGGVPGGCWPVGWPATQLRSPLVAIPRRRRVPSNEIYSFNIHVPARVHSSLCFSLSAVSAARSPAAMGSANLDPDPDPVPRGEWALPVDEYPRGLESRPSLLSSDRPSFSRLRAGMS